MSQKSYREFHYIEKEDYDKKLKVNDEDLRVYSEKKLKDLYPEGDYRIAGETFEKKKRDRENDIGRIELNEKRLYIAKDGDHSRLFKKQSAFVETDGGDFIALLKCRLLPILLLLGLLLGGIAGALYALLGGGSLPAGGDSVPTIRPIESELLTVSGSVTRDGRPVEAAALSLQSGSREIAVATTGKDGRYLIVNAENGHYNLVCRCGDSVLTKLVSVNGLSVTVDFSFPADESAVVKGTVEISEGAPAIAAGGLDTEVLRHAAAGREVAMTLLAKRLDAGQVPEAERKAITALSGELNLTYLELSLLKEVFRGGVPESSEYLKTTETVLELAVPYDSSRAIGTYVFRYLGGSAERLEELSERPGGALKDGTYFVSADTVFLYTSRFTTFAIGFADAGRVVKGSDTISYSDTATIDLKTGRIAMLYKHDADSSNDARLELYLVGDTGNLLISGSDRIPVGYQINEMQLSSEVKSLPSVGTYRGLMKIIYLNESGNTSTNVDIPLTVAITR